MPQRRPPDIAWSARAACKGSLVHYPVRYPRALRRAQTAAAKAVCATCPVIRECLEHTVTNQENDGVWGGYLFPLGVRSFRRKQLRETGTG